MTNEMKMRLVGVAMMLPLVFYILYLILSGKLVWIVLPLLLFGVLAHFGLKLAKGKSASDVANDALNRASRVDRDSASIGSSLR